MKKTLIILFSSFLFLSAKGNLSLLSLEENPYGSYLKTLIIEQNLTKNDIKKLLAEKRLSVKGSILKALYQQYYKKDMKSASFYYDQVIGKVPNLVKNTSNSMYIADYLVIKERFTDIKKILDINYCNTLLTKDVGKCAYYVFLSKKKTFTETFEEMNILNKKENRLYKNKLKLEGELWKRY